MLVLVIRTSASVGFSMRASGTSSTLTLRGPWYTTAFMGDLLTVLDSGGTSCTELQARHLPG
jgi:hypothetical protein